MPGQSSARGRPDRAVPLTIVRLPRPAAAAAVGAAWNRGEAVAVLDPAAPPAVVDQLTHLLDPDAGAEPGTAAVVVTSGTTGSPKAVELTTAGRDAMGRGFAAALGTADGDRWLVCLPLHHVAGLAILARARVSGATVTVDDGFDVERVGRAPRTHGATLVSVVPTMLHRLLEARAPIHEYRAIVVGGAPTPPSLRERAEAAGARVVDAYGLSETWGGVVLDGVALPGADVAVSDDGEILVWGDMVMRRYRGDAAATRHAFTADGAFRTGDVGVVDAAGRVHVVDRRRDLVITGGVNVSPTAVESVLGEHPDVDDVCVVGAPDHEWGERVVAYVVARDGAAPPSLDALRDFAGGRLSRPQLPRQVVLVDAIPRSPGGKALRRELRAP